MGAVWISDIVFAAPAQMFALEPGKHLVSPTNEFRERERC